MSRAVAKILVIDDDAKIRDLVCRYLKKSGYDSAGASDSAEAEDMMAGLAPDLLVVDRMMPGEDGFAFIRRLRARGDQTPAIILTAAGAKNSRLSGLKTGADDFLAKPFLPKELLLRIGIILKRAGAAPAQSGYNPDTGEFSRGGKKVRLTGAEQKLVGCLLAKNGLPANRYEIAEAMKMDARSVDVWIARLRGKIEEDPKNPSRIITVRNVGYKMGG